MGDVIEMLQKVVTQDTARLQHIFKIASPILHV